jgi:hypothetical protein
MGLAAGPGAAHASTSSVKTITPGVLTVAEVGDMPYTGLDQATGKMIGVDGEFMEAAARDLRLTCSFSSGRMSKRSVPDTTASMHVTWATFRRLRHCIGIVEKEHGHLLVGLRPDINPAVDPRRRLVPIDLPRRDGDALPLTPIAVVEGQGILTFFGYTLAVGRALAGTRHAGTLVLLGEPRSRKSEDAMRVGLQIPSFTWPGGAADIRPRLAQIGRTADEAGFANVWVVDHFFQIPVRGGQAEEPMLEGYSALSYLAAVTQRACLGTLVTVTNSPSRLSAGARTLRNGWKRPRARDQAPGRGSRLEGEFPTST